MMKLDRFQTQAEQITKDLHALSILISGMQDSDVNKLATATFARAIAKNALSLSKQLTTDADKLSPIKEATIQLQTASATTP